MAKNNLTTNKLFKAEPEVDLLIDIKTTDKSMTIAEVCNKGILNAFLPCYSGILVSEARFILQKENISQRDFRQALSRAISWLANHYISSPTILEKILSYYRDSFADKLEFDDENCNSEVGIDLMKDVNSRLTSICHEEIIYTTLNPILLSKQILSCWDRVYKEKVMYTMLSFATLTCENERLFSRGDILNFLKEFEDEVIIERMGNEFAFLKGPGDWHYYRKVGEKG